MLWIKDRVTRQKALTILAPLTAVIAPAAAATDEWLAFSGGSDDTTFLIRPKDVAQGPGQHEVWVKADYSKAKNTPDRSGMFFYRVRCEARQIGMLSIVTYRPDGSTRLSKEFPYPEMKAVVPDSIGETLLGFVCPTMAEFLGDGGVAKPN